MKRAGRMLDLLDDPALPDGTAYVTDSFGAAVYRVPVNGEPSVLVKDDRLGGASFGPNGIAWNLLFAGTLSDVFTVRPQ